MDVFEVVFCAFRDSYILEYYNFMQEWTPFNNIGKTTTPNRGSTEMSKSLYCDDSKKHSWVY